MEQKTLITEQIVLNQAFIDQVTEQFMPLPLATLNQRPSEGSWSILECLEHINVTTEYYLNQLVAIQSGNSTQDFGQHKAKTSWMVRQFAQSLRPSASKKIRFKMKTFKNLEPSNFSGSLDKKVIDHYCTQHANLLAFCKEANALNLNQYKVISAIGKLLTFNIGEALLFLSAHTQRHLQQCTNTLLIVNKK